MKRFALSLYVFALLSSSPALAWNALGHKVVCAIAWDQLDDETRKQIADTLRRHPRFDEDFAKKLDNIDNDELIFQHAGTWPDIARGIRGKQRSKFDNPTWHYVNFPLFLGPERRISANLDTDLFGEAKKWNVLQATQFSARALESNESPAHKALAYCWLAHLVADLHQPCHSTVLFCDRFPNGDRGGNSIKTKQGGNLHSLWDNLLGKSHKPNNVKRIVFDLKQRKELWGIDTD